MKDYTTIEQSKKLIELCIDVYTADMYYFSNLKIPGVLSYSQMLEHFKKKQSELNDSGINADVPDLIPCWSTEALLDILDETIITNENEEYHLAFGKDGTSYYMYYYKLKKNDRINKLDFSCSTLLNCAFEMIVKLKELKLI